MTTPTKAKESIQLKLKKFYNRSDLKLGLLGKLLLIKQLKDSNLDHKLLLESMQVDQYGKPFFNNYFNFSISHSDDIAICAACRNEKIGIDVEKIKNIDIDDFLTFFNEREQHAIKASNDRLTNFYNFWTCKESLVKAIGKGMSIVNLVDVVDGWFSFENVGYYISSIKLKKGYCASVATSSEDVNYDISEVTPNSIYDIV